MKGRKVLVELRLTKPDKATAKEAAVNLERFGFVWDEDYEPIHSIEEQTVLIRGSIDERVKKELESAPSVKKVWSDSRIEPF